MVRPRLNAGVIVLLYVISDNGKWFKPTLSKSIAQARAYLESLNGFLSLLPSVCGIVSRQDHPNCIIALRRLMKLRVEIHGNCYPLPLEYLAVPINPVAFVVQALTLAQANTCNQLLAIEAQVPSAHGSNFCSLIASGNLANIQANSQTKAHPKLLTVVLVLSAQSICNGVWKQIGFPGVISDIAIDWCTAQLLLQQLKSCFLFIAPLKLDLLLRDVQSLMDSILAGNLHGFFTIGSRGRGKNGLTKKRTKKQRQIDKTGLGMGKDWLNLLHLIVNLEAFEVISSYKLIELIAQGIEAREPLGQLFRPLTQKEWPWF
ncbi:hypothetical protein Tco_0531464 [Tanacetum coccineum]